MIWMHLLFYKHFYTAGLNNPYQEACQSQGLQNKGYLHQETAFISYLGKYFSKFQRLLKANLLRHITYNSSVS